MSKMFLTVNKEPQLYDVRTLETMTILAFAAQLTAAILYSSAVYCVLYNKLYSTVQQQYPARQLPCCFSEHLDLEIIG